MPAGSAAALICDTGALIDYLVETAPDHRLFRDAIDRAGTRYVPGLVLAEVDYFLRYERPAMQGFMRDLRQVPSPTRRRRLVNSHARWTSTDALPISVWVWSTPRSWPWPNFLASLALPRVMPLRGGSTLGWPGLRAGRASDRSRPFLIPAHRPAPGRRPPGPPRPDWWL